MKRIGILTGGGDAPGLNAAIRAVVKTSLGIYGNQVFGIRRGFEGLLAENGVFPLDYEAIRGILPRGGTILGAASRGNPFAIQVQEGGQTVTRDASDEVVDRIHELGLDMIVAVGGDGTLAIARELIKKGAPFVGIPKTIDNDVCGTDMTIGYDTAVGMATDALDRLHTTAESHHRAMVLELMGRYAGYIALMSGVAGGADVILIPEIPFRYEVVFQKIRARVEQGTHFSLLAVSEGAQPEGGERIYQDVQVEGQPKLGGVGEQVAQHIQEQCGVEARATVLGHLQRGGSPTPYDRWLASQFGALAAQLAHQGRSGRMVALRNGQVTDIDIVDSQGKARQVPLDDHGLGTARSLGICLGDRYQAHRELEE
ncbi:MAG: ATP-dependent 6-phosphofructokinase [Brevefilum sp.]|nr:ATP-dependent 6-phosphofructokinase [Brevefilum sp.]